jgi:hypothetical protein
MPERIHSEQMVRAARNQALFREVNESVREVNEAFGEIVPPAEWVCECAHPTCVERMTLTIDEYKALRAGPTRFAVAPSDATSSSKSKTSLPKRSVIGSSRS